MFRGTTPVITIEVETGLDLEEAKQIWVTLSNDLNKTLGGNQPPYVLTKEKQDIEVTGNNITVSFTQDETLKLREGIAEIQVRVLMPDGYAYASNIAKAEVDRIISRGVID